MTQLGSKKSRKGCTSCKLRRVKCNEEAPCANCLRRGDTCSLLGPPSTASSVSGRQHDALPNSTDEWLLDLELMHHYLQSTSLQALGIRDQMQLVWRDHIPREALKYPFLMHGILAFSALHIASTKPADEAARYLTLCDKHQTLALETFRTVLAADITPQMSTALFALASTLSMSSMARSCALAVSRSPHIIDMEQVAELFTLVRGVHEVIATCQRWVNQGPLGPLLHGHDMPNGSLRRWPAEVEARFDALQSMLVKACADDAQALDDCRSALLSLRDIYQCVVYYRAQDDLQTGQVWRWATMVSVGYVRLVKSAFAPALVVLAHFAAASLAITNAWYANMWGNFTMEGICMAMAGSELMPWLDWPILQGKNNMAILTGRKGTSPELHLELSLGS